MAQDYLLFSNDKFNNHILPIEIVEAFNLPTIDEDGNPISYTIRGASGYIKQGAADPLPIILTPDVGYQECDEADATHWVCGINNLTEKNNQTFKQLVDADGADYLNVKLKPFQVLHLRETGVILQ